MKTRADIIRDTIKDAVLDLMDYNRREDEELCINEIEQAIAAGEIRAESMVELFAAELGDWLGMPPGWCRVRRAR